MKNAATAKFIPATARRDLDALMATYKTQGLAPAQLARLRRLASIFNVPMP